MVLYAADISKLALPVKSVQRKKVKEQEPETNQVEQPIERPKKKLTKKQQEALKKGQDALKLKREGEELEQPKKKRAVKKLVEEEIDEMIEELPVPKKKRVTKSSPEASPEPEEAVKPKPKRKQKEVAVEEEEPKAKKIRVKKLKEPAEEIEEKQEEVKPKRKPKAKRDNSIPPAWFNKYVENVKREEASLRSEKVPERQIKEEAKEAANKSWNDGLTRDRVTHEIDNHMARMYSQIFARN